MNLKLPAKAYSLVAVPLLFELAFVFTLVYLQGQLELSYNKEIQARRLANVINQGLADCLKAGTYGALSQMGGGSILLKEGRSKLKDLYRVKERLLGLKDLSAIDRRSIESISASIDSILKNFPDPNSVPKENTNYMMSLHVAVQELLDEANLFLDRQSQIQEIQQSEQNRLRTFITNSVMTGVVFNIVLAVFLAWSFNQSIIRRLNVVLENALRLADSKELLPEVGGSDEIANLDSVFHRMAGVIEKATEREKALLANCSDVIFAVDYLLEIQVVSNAVKRLWKYAPEELLGAEIDSIIHVDDLDRVRNGLLALKDSSSSCQLEARVKLKDGSFMDASLSAYYSSPENQIFCVAHDINERRKLERQKEDFLSMVSHDLRSPLTSLILTFDMLIKGSLGKLNEDGQTLASTSKSDLERLKRLVSDLLDADRLEKGKMDIEMQEFLSVELKETVLNSVSQQALEKGINLKSEWQTMKVNCDKDRMIQVLINLVGNAIKFSQSDSTVEFNFRKVANTLQFEVIDSGRGIPADQFERIFDKFRQVSVRDATNYGGSGLGLAICKALVEAHKGTILVRSEPGKGSCFTVTIPA